MDITEFIGKYKNHPVLFIGSGFSFRYLKNTYTWDGLLSKISEDLYENDEPYLDIKASCKGNSFQKCTQIASILESRFNTILSENRNGKFKEINDIFYDKMREGTTLSRFKIYISKLVESIDYNDEMQDEIAELKKIRKNIGSVITTNYDCFVESIFEFDPLIGNDILLSNPYGAVYKIHGCTTDASKMIITENDYKEFDERYELIRAQLLSLFIHNPIIFLGYGMEDGNIKKVLKTIFTYVALNTEQAEKIRNNFLLVEYDKDSTNLEITEHDIEIEGFSTIHINKVKTDNFKSIYTALANIHLPVSAMDVRKVQNIVKEINAGGSIKVHITENIEDMRNGDRILAIGSTKSITYQYMSLSDMIQGYFKIIEESNSSLLSLIDKHNVYDSQYFPIYGFSNINPNIQTAAKLKRIQKANIIKSISATSTYQKTTHKNIDDILNDTSISKSNKTSAIMWVMNNNGLDLAKVTEYLKNYPDKKSTQFRKMLCLYDYKIYNKE